MNWGDLNLGERGDDGDIPPQFLKWKQRIAEKAAKQARKDHEVYVSILSTTREVLLGGNR